MWIDGVEMEVNKIIIGDALAGLKLLNDESVQCCITSPPYWGHRDYGVVGQYGQENTPQAYVQKLVAVFNQVKRVLKTDGTVWLNLSDAYKVIPTSKSGKKSTLKVKDLIGIPWMVAFALRKSGWYLRQDIIWNKPNPMPEKASDRCSKGHEYIFLLSKSPKYYFDSKIIREPAAYDGRKALFSKGSPKYLNANIPFSGKAHPRWQRNCAGEFVRNKRSVWTIPLKSYKGAHCATFPAQLPTLCLLAGSREGDIILDPFMGAGTTAIAAMAYNRNYIGFELNPEYAKIAKMRISEQSGLFNLTKEVQDV